MTEGVGAVEGELQRPHARGRGRRAGRGAPRPLARREGIEWRFGDRRRGPQGAAAGVLREVLFVEGEATVAERAADDGEQLVGGELAGGPVGAVVVEQRGEGAEPERLGG